MDREFNITGFTGSNYSLEDIVVSEIDEGYTDASGLGKFHYEPPTGFSALHTNNLDTPAISDPGEHFRCTVYKEVVLREELRASVSNQISSGVSQGLMQKDKSYLTVLEVKNQDILFILIQ